MTTSTPCWTFSSTACKSRATSASVIRSVILSPIIAGIRAGRLRQLLEWIEDLQSRTPEVPVVASGNRQTVSPCRGRDVAIFDGHPLAGFVEEPLLVSPYVRYRDVEAVDSPVQCLHQAREPQLQSLTVPSVLGAHPIGQLRNDNRAGVTAVLLFLKPGDHPGVAVPLGWLTDDVCVEQPAHNLRRLGTAARRGGTS